MVLCNGEDMAAKLRRLRMYGTEKTYYAIEHGYNSRLDELQAEILLRKLQHLNQYISRRRALAKRYDEKLAGLPLALPAVLPGNTHAYYLYVCRHPRRDTIIAELAKRDINVNISYPWPIHLMTGYRHLGYREGDLPKTEAAAKEIFSLPMYPALFDAEQDTVCDALSEIVGAL
jgi:aminotransferase EvaB